MQKNLSLSVERRYTAKFFDEATTCRERTQTTQTRVGFVRLDPIVCLARPYPLLSIVGFLGERETTRPTILL
jgi:hypothetical protein